MLRPDDRSHLSVLMRPPIGYAVDSAVGTTFSLDLLAALLVPLGFAVHDWTDEKGEARDPLVALEAIHRHSEKLTIFCEGGQIKAPKEYRRLMTWLEEVVCEVRSPDPDGVFHPKLWVLRFTKADEPVRYRVLCLSRNLSFDRSWDTALALDGELANRERGVSRNHPLADFVQALPKLARQPLSEARRAQVRKLAEELRRVNFEAPQGFDDFRFWSGGMEGRGVSAWDRVDKALIVSPFVSDSVIEDLTQNGVPTFLVSRPDTLQALKPETLEACEAVYALDPHASQPGANEETPDAVPREEMLSGLHAKLFVMDRGWNTSVFTGSFNATHHAFHRNVEFMVELVGKRSRVGVDEFLRPASGGIKFIDLLTPFKRSAEEGTESAQEDADKLFRVGKRALLDAEPILTVSQGTSADYFELSLGFRASPHLHSKLQVVCRPISLETPSARPLAEARFSNISLDRLSPLLAFDLSVTLSGTCYHCLFVTKAHLEGAPADRQQRVFASLLSDKVSLSRFLLLLLSNSDPSGETASDALDHFSGGEDSHASSKSSPALFETLLRTLAKQPAQLDRIEKVMRDLQASGEGESLVDEEFRALWEPIWKARQGRAATR